MTHPTPSIQSSFVHKSGLVTVKWYDLDPDQPLPDLSWQQVYVIGNINGKVPIVHYSGSDRDNLPGGKTEHKETVDETVRREILEELNCTVKSWVPLGYQECLESNGNTLYQLRVAAKLKIIDTFHNDPGGSVVGFSLVPLKDLNSHIQYGEIGDRLVELTKKTKFRYQ